MQICPRLVLGVGEFQSLGQRGVHKTCIAAQSEHRQVTTMRCRHW